MFRDLRFGLRLLWKDRGYAATALLTLAVCIGANTAAFTIVNSVLLRPLPIPDSGRILLMSNQYPKAGGGLDHSVNSGVPDYYDRLRDVHVFEEQAMFNGANQSFEIDNTPELVHGTAVTPSLFRLLQVAPIRGRIFDESEGELGRDQEVILSYGLWQQLYGGKNDGMNQQIRLGGRPFTLVGVMPRGFQFVDPEARFWIPLAFTAQQKSDDARHGNNWMNVGRLKPGATVEQAQAQVNAVNAANLDRFPKYKQLLINSGFHTSVEQLQSVLVRDIRPTLYLLWGGAALVLLIGCVNIANLTLARTHVRMRELCTRLTLGAMRGQLARQLTIESLMLSLAGGACGILAGIGILRALQAIGLDRLPRANEIHIDATVLGVSLAISLIVGVLIGLVPVAHLFSVNLNAVLREENRSGTGNKARKVRSVLVVVQVAFAFVLLIGSALLLASFRNLLAVDAGFKAEGVITAGIGMPRLRYATDNDVRLFTQRSLEAIRNVPGVILAGGTTLIPLSGNHSDSVVFAEGYQMKPGESPVSPIQAIITPGYLEAMGTPLVRGRFFDAHDTGTSPGVIIVDGRLARKFWPNADPIGKRMYQPKGPQDIVSPGPDTKWLTVVGVVHTVQIDDIALNPDSVGGYYLPATQVVPRGLAIAIKTRGDQEAILRNVRAELKKLDPAMPLSNVRTMTEYTSRSLMPRKAAMLLALSFGAVSLFLSAIGIYGVLVYLVTQRSREIGIRIALGSTAAGIFHLIIREGLWLVASGLVLGLIGAVGLRSTLQGQIYGIGALDPVVIGSVIATLAIIAVIACSLPALRATRVDPVTVLND